MNKKVALSLLSATVFASMTASAFAAPKSGVYMGGDVDRYYALTDLFKLNDAGYAKFQSDLAKTKFENLIFVDHDGKGASLKEILSSTQDFEKIKRDLKQTDFEGEYAKSNLDGTNGESYDPRKDITPEPTGELKVESVSAINSKGESVALNNATNIDANAHVVLKFPVALDQNTVNLNTIKLVEASGAQVAGQYTYNNFTKTVTFVPAAVLKDATKYTLTVTKDVKSSDGKVFAESKYEFTTDSKAVVSRLQVVNAIITNNGDRATAGGDDTLGAGETVVLTFNKDVDPATVTTSTIKLYDETNKRYVTEDDGVITYNSANRTATFTLGGNESITNATIRVEAKGLKTLAGADVAEFSKSFVLGGPVQPAVQNNLNGAQNVYPKLQAATINGQYQAGFRASFVFNRAMNASTINDNTVEIREAGSTVGIPTTVTFDSAAGLLTITPKADLKDRQQYTIWFDTRNIKDANGVAITDPQVSFTTGDFTRPTVAETTPANAATNVVESNSIRIKFSEPIDRNTVAIQNAVANQLGANQSIVLVDSNNNGFNLNGTLSYEDADKVLVINTAGLNLQRNTTYTVKLNGGIDAGAITDRANVNGAGLALDSDYEFTFTTRVADTGIPTVQSVKVGSNDLEGRYNVRNNADIVVTFDEAVQAPAQSVVAAFVDTTGQAANINVAIENVTFRNGNKEMVIPANQLGNLVSADGQDSAYRLTIQNLRDTAGNVMLPKVVQFTSGPAPTVTPGVVDADGDGQIGQGENTSVAYATGVAVNAGFQVTINDGQNGSGVASSTVNENTLYIREKGTTDKVPAQIIAGANGSYIIDPIGDLKENAEYEIVVEGVKDNAGNTATSATYSFKTVSNARPTVTIDPAEGSTNVPVTTEVKVTFNMAMNVQSINSNTIQLWIDADGDGAINGQEAAIPARVTYDTATKTATLKPVSALAPNAVYSVIVNVDNPNTAGQFEGVVSANNTTLARAAVETFQTEAQAAQTKLVSAKHIEVGTNDGLANDKLVLTFSSALDQTTVEQQAANALNDISFSADTGIVAGDIASYTLAKNDTQLIITFASANVTGTITDGFSTVSATSLDDVNGVVVDGSEVTIEK